ncbi:MAG: hypothetical protein QG564_127 [Campylobacterota bacterium]|nr:hypothetical protein [Campylobacterota bacterium]
MNNFILIQSREKTIHILPEKHIDKWYLINNENGIQTIDPNAENYTLSDAILFGFESQSGIIDFNDKKVSLIIGDFYKMCPDDSKAIMEYIQTDTKNEVYSNVGGAFSWINIFLEDKKIEINTDMFGQLPLFYYHDENVFAISTSIDLLLKSFPDIPRNVNMERIIEFIVSTEISNYFLTFFKYIHRLKGNRRLTLDNLKNPINISTYASLDDFRDPAFSFTSKNLRKDIEAVIKAVTYDKKTAYNLSGGTDSTLLSSVGAILSPQKITCYTASTGFGNDLKFARIAASYMGADLKEVDIDYNILKSDNILELIKANGRPIHIWGNNVGNTTIADKAKKDGFDIMVSGSSEHVVSGGIFESNIKLFIFEAVKNRNWKLLFDTLRFNKKYKLLSFWKTVKEIYHSFSSSKDIKPTYLSKIKGKDFQGFFNPDIQHIRDNAKSEKISYHLDIFDFYKNYFDGEGGALQKFTYQTYHSGKAADISVRMPYLDTRFIKYIDHDKHLFLHNKHNKQFAKEAMCDIMDPIVTYRKNTHGLKWSSLEFLKRNKNEIVNEIKTSPFLKSILSKKTLEDLNKPTFRKSLLLSLYSVALFDKIFHIKV